MKVKIFALGALILALSTTARAEISVAEYRKIDHKNQVLRAYMHGASAGIEASNNELIFAHATPFFCQPENLALNVDNVFDMLDRLLDTQKQPPPETPITMLMMIAYRRTFPCK